MSHAHVFSIRCADIPWMFAGRARHSTYFEHAYRTGYDAFFRYPGKSFDEVEESVALDYDREKTGSALPWDTVRPAVNSVWERVSGVIGPRDPDRGMRSSI